MCGIVGAIAKRDVVPILLEGLKRLEYRGYDSAGLAVLNPDHEIIRTRVVGKVGRLVEAVYKQQLRAPIGIAHTRWATHGKPNENNAHPHQSGEIVSLVHNGIIENHDHLREFLRTQHYEFVTETDTEVVAHLLAYHLKKADSALAAIQATVKELEGAYALAIMLSSHPDELFVVRSGCPLVIGLGLGENYLASDSLALLPVTQRFIYLEEGDIGIISCERVSIFDKTGKACTRAEKAVDYTYDQVDKGNYRHFMQKEIFEQATAISCTLEGRLSKHHVLIESFGTDAADIFNQVRQVQIIACGTSYHAGLVAKYWLESMAKIQCQVEVASEYRYRDKVVLPGTLLIIISQSGETADSLAALKQSKDLGFLASLAICNVPESSIVRESDLVFMTRAGMEIGVASTKAFTTQLVSLLLLTVVLARNNPAIHFDEPNMVERLNNLPTLINNALALDSKIATLAELFAEKEHALFLGRGSEYPIAMEGALKLKEISYIHAEAYPAGELKHGPLALVDKHMPVIAVAPKDHLLDKLKSNLHEVQARGGQLIVFADKEANIHNESGLVFFEMPAVCQILAPIVYTIPLQLLAYHVAVLKGTDVDQPRNLAKSVTVE